MTEVSIFIHEDFFQHLIHLHHFTDNIMNVWVSMQPDFATEGAVQFTLQYSILQGIVEQQMWLFHGIQINSNAHYSVENRSLVVHRPTRNDTGQYTLLLTNPFSSVTVNSNVTVRCKFKQL